MSEPNDDQASKLIESLSGKMVEAILPKITESVENQIKGVVAKNDELLDKLHNMKTDVYIANQAAEVAKLLGKTPPDTTPAKPQNIVLSKADARDVRKYQAAKKQAAEAGVGLVIDRDG